MSMERIEKLRIEFENGKKEIEAASDKVHGQEAICQKLLNLLVELPKRFPINLRGDKPWNA